MDLQARVMDILEGRAKMGAGQFSGLQMSKSRGGVKAGVKAGAKKSNARRAAAKKNPWIKHVKKVQKETGLSYPEAMKVASASYKGSARKPAKRAAPKRAAPKRAAPKRAARKPAKRAAPKRAGAAKSSQWIDFVKEFAKLNKISYGDALKCAGPHYRRWKAEGN